jgi:6-phosphogluconolactonase (cycloisomerase 2 family)
VLVPAGRSGNLDVIDPVTRTVRAFGGFTQQADYGGGHDDSVTSVDDTGAALAATDRTAGTLVVLAPDTGAIVATAKLAAHPDYVRWVASTNELWVTQPDAEQIEIFTLAAGGKPTTTKQDRIAIKGGPESLVIDNQRKRAFTHLWDGSTVAIDLQTRKLVATWPNHCKGSRGIALDAARGLLFVGCDEGRATALDVAHDGKLVGSAATGKGVDIIAYDAARAHLYVPGGDSATLTILGVKPSGALAALGSVAVATDSHCVAADDRGHAYVCDPKRGALLVVTDPFPATK